jgi:hypothetical protein
MIKAGKVIEKISTKNKSFDYNKSMRVDRVG